MWRLPPYLVVADFTDDGVPKQIRESAHTVDEARRIATARQTERGIGLLIICTRSSVMERVGDPDMDSLQPYLVAHMPGRYFGKLPVFVAECRGDSLALINTDCAACAQHCLTSGAHGQCPVTKRAL
jgi:hypothetical protein